MSEGLAFPALILLIMDLSQPTLEASAASVVPVELRRSASGVMWHYVNAMNVNVKHMVNDIAWTSRRPNAKM